MKILFLCKGNVGRSQMAEALFNTMQDEHEGVSAGIQISGPVQTIGSLLPKTKEVIDVMLEEGTDVSFNERKQLTEEMTKDADKIVLIMGEEEAELPSFLAGNPKLERWILPDPKGMDMAFTRNVRDRIKEEISRLISRL